MHAVSAAVSALVFAPCPDSHRGTERGHCLSSLWLPGDWKVQGSSALLSMVREKCQLLSGVVLVGLENSMPDPLQPAQQRH